MAVLLAALASVAWGLSDFLGGYTSRRLSVPVVLLLSQLAGLVLIGAVVVARGSPLPTHSGRWYAAGAGLASIAALGLLYLAITRGPMLLVAPIAAVGALVPVTVGAAAGESVGALVGLGIGCALAGSALASWNPAQLDRGGGYRLVAGAPAALGAALAMGAFFVLLGRASATDPYGATATARAVAVLAAGGLALAARWERGRSVPAGRLPVRTGLVVAAVGVCDVVAETAFATASTHGALGVTSVVSSLYPAVTVVLAAGLLGEGASLVQLCGVVTALVGVGLLASAG